METNPQPLLCISRSVVSMVTLYQSLLCTSSSGVSMITLCQQLFCISGSYESMVTLYWQLLCISSSVVSMATLYQQLVTSSQYILLLARVHVQAPVSPHLSPIDGHLLLTPCFICPMLFHASVYVIFQVIQISIFPPCQIEERPCRSLEEGLRLGTGIGKGTGDRTSTQSNQRAIVSHI